MKAYFSCKTGGNDLRELWLQVECCAWTVQMRPSSLFNLVWFVSPRHLVQIITVCEYVLKVDGSSFPLEVPVIVR